jgi:hypothetical protein
VVFLFVATAFVSFAAEHVAIDFVQDLFLIGIQDLLDFEILGNRQFKKPIIEPVDLLHQCIRNRTLGGVILKFRHQIGPNGAEGIDNGTGFQVVVLFNLVVFEGLHTVEIQFGTEHALLPVAATISIAIRLVVGVAVVKPGEIDHHQGDIRRTEQNHKKPRQSYL